MNIRQELKALDDHLKDAIEQTRKNWIDQQLQMNPGTPEENLIPAEQAMGSDMRPILTPLLISRAEILVTLATMPNKGDVDVVEE